MLLFFYHLIIADFFTVSDDLWFPCITPGAALPRPPASSWKRYRGLRQRLPKEPQLLQHMRQRRLLSLFQSECRALTFRLLALIQMEPLCTGQK